MVILASKATNPEFLLWLLKPFGLLEIWFSAGALTCMATQSSYGAQTWLCRASKSNFCWRRKLWNLPLSAHLRRLLWVFAWLYPSSAGCWSSLWLGTCLRFAALAPSAWSLGKSLLRFWIGFRLAYARYARFGKSQRCWWCVGSDDWSHLARNGLWALRCSSESTASRPIGESSSPSRARSDNFECLRWNCWLGTRRLSLLSDCACYACHGTRSVKAASNFCQFRRLSQMGP